MAFFLGKLNISDLPNPFLVKETRQALRSKVLHITIIATTLASAFLVVLGLILYHQENYIIYGSTIFNIIYRILWIILVGFFPLFYGVRFFNERHTGEFELFEITTLSPRRIIRGKIQSAIVLTFLIIAITTPFLIICTFLTAISALEILFFIGLLFLVSMVSFNTGILIGSLKVNKVSIVLLNILFAAVLIIFSMFVNSFLAFGYYFSDILNFNSATFSVFLIILLLYLYYDPLIRIAARASITSQIGLKSLGLRLFLFVFIGILLLIGIVLQLAIANSIVDLEFFVNGNYIPFLWIAYFLMFMPVLIISQFALLKGARLCPYGLRKRFKKGILRIFRFLFYPGQGSARMWYSFILLFLFIIESLVIKWTIANYLYASFFIYHINTLSVCLSLMLFYSVIGVILGKLVKPVIKHRRSALQMAIFMNIFIIILSIFLEAGGVENAIELVPFYYLGVTRDYDSLAIIVLLIVFLNFIYGLFLYRHQLSREYKEAVSYNKKATNNQENQA